MGQGVWNIFKISTCALLTLAGYAWAEDVGSDIPPAPVESSPLPPLVQTSVLSTSLMLTKTEMQAISTAIQQSLEDPLELLRRQQALEAAKKKPKVEASAVGASGADKQPTKQSTQLEFKPIEQAGESLAAWIDVQNGWPPEQAPEFSKAELEAEAQDDSALIFADPAKDAPIFALESIFYMGKDKWMVVINGKVISNDEVNQLIDVTPKDLKTSVSYKITVNDVRRDSVVVSWQCPYISKLSPHLNEVLYEEKNGSFANPSRSIRLSKNLQELDFIIHVNQRMSVSKMQLENWSKQ